MATWATQSESDADWLSRYAPACETCGANPCYSLCPASDDYYSPEREREDALLQDSLSQDEWYRQAVAQYERVHGTPYVS